MDGLHAMVDALTLSTSSAPRCTPVEPPRLHGPRCESPVRAPAQTPWQTSRRAPHFAGSQANAQDLVAQGSASSRQAALLPSLMAQEAQMSAAVAVALGASAQARCRLLMTMLALRPWPVGFAVERSRHAGRCRVCARGQVGVGQRREVLLGLQHRGARVVDVQKPRRLLNT